MDAGSGGARLNARSSWRGPACAACLMVTRACLSHIPPRPLRVHFNCHGANQLSSQSSRKVRSICRGAVCAKQAGATLGQFHVTVYVTNPRSAHIATEAMLDRTLIAMSSDIDEDVTVTGFVQSI